MGSCQLSCFKHLTLCIYPANKCSNANFNIYEEHGKKFITSRTGEAIALNYNFSTKQKIKRFKLPGHIFLKRGHNFDNNLSRDMRV